MNKLFEDTEGMVNIRPKEMSKKQKANLLNEIALEIVKEGYTTDNDSEMVLDILEELFEDDYRWGESGFELAKEIENIGSFVDFEFNGDFIDYLDSLEHKRYNVIDNNVRLWIKAFDIKPKYAQGQKMEKGKALSRFRELPKVFYITRIKEENGYYWAHEDKERNGGWNIPFEDLELDSKPID